MLSLMPRIRALYSVCSQGGEGGRSGVVVVEGQEGGRWRKKVRELQRKKQWWEGLSIQQSEQQSEQKKGKKQNRNDSDESEN